MAAAPPVRSPRLTVTVLPFCSVVPCVLVTETIRTFAEKASVSDTALAVSGPLLVTRNVHSRASPVVTGLVDVVWDRDKSAERTGSETLLLEGFGSVNGVLAVKTTTTPAPGVLVKRWSAT